MFLLIIVMILCLFFLKKLGLREGVMGERITKWKSNPHWQDESSSIQPT